jgi:hypothetical protein
MLTVSKQTRMSGVWWFTGYNNCMNWSEFFTIGSDYPVSCSGSHGETKEGTEKEPIEFSVEITGIFDM